MGEWRQSFLTIAVGGVGALIASLIHMPMALLAGPAIAVSLAGLWGAPMDIAPRLRDAAFLVMGLSIGSMVSPESFAAMMRWPVAFGLLAALTIVTPFAGRSLVPRILPFERHESFLAAAPGHLGLVIALADSLSLSLTRPMVLASIRLMSLTLLVPLGATLAGMEIGFGLPGSAAVTPLGWIAIQIAIALAIAPLLRRIKLPAPTLIAGITVAATTHLGGWTAGGLPGWGAQGALILMGSLIGGRFTGMSWRELQGSLLAGGVIVLLTCGLAVAAALPAAYLSGLPLLDVLLGFSPGGLETMIILGAALGADPTFVAAAHLFRLMVLAVVLMLYATRVANSAALKSDGQDAAPRAD
ncbi:AbrB family transcriptional regulator [Phaeobacter gallaeciensis]|uniref:AbrB family transcriptional regulator n=1 Tax=Phaeobacter gallaeciensis TaxID=60890 RepID=UPI0023802971|nr:AbrB family transcriptional regulator [Phaeobacter gallaeciensis]MDE4273716.1 AbrB family transcriptional regulator [Phaeobacter gallaeciensis]MDE4298956.1 AbrB family transcriptional regulator [Phaeobacter gallaeciensis]MDE5183702.1 AbrB family transcriptional regulator [Phaeobacter gallaeciensis]